MNPGKAGGLLGEPLKGVLDYQGRSKRHPQLQLVVVFLFGFLVPRAPRYLGWLGIAVNVVLYGALKIAAPGIPFLNRMAICFGVVFLVMAVITAVKPLAQPVVMPTTDLIALESSKKAKVYGIGVVIATLILYVIFW